MVRKILRCLAYILLTIFVIVGVYMLCAIILSGIEVKAEPETTHDVEIYIVTNGVHADIVVPIRAEQMDWSKQILFAHTREQDSLASFVSFGWGDRQFYIETPEWKDLKWKTAMKAILGLNSTAIHTTFYKSLNEGTDCKKLILNKNQYERLVMYIENSFTKNVDGSFVQIGPELSYGPNDAFYEAQGNYNLFFTSNTWTNDALKACGQKACVWTPFDKGIFHHYNKQKREEIKN
ncbi:MAG TPA: TIGR02117 family protein [Saprospiraceae bacterium]